MTFWDERTKTLLLMGIGVGLCTAIFLTSFWMAYFNPTTYTIEVYEIFEVQHKTDRHGQPWTFVYTYGQGKFYFRGHYEVNVSKGYSFTFQLYPATRKYVDLKMIEYHSFEKWYSNGGDGPDFN